MHRERYRKLVRAVVIRAALDYVMLRFPRPSGRELLEWFHSEHKNPAPTPLAIQAWRTRQVDAITHFFDDCGGDLARAAGCHDVIDKARGELDRNRVWQVFQRRKPATKRLCTLRRSEGRCARGGGIGNARVAMERDSRWATSQSKLNARR